MLYGDMIKEGIRYVEDNIRADISPQELADRAGFSLYHYYRLFQSMMGMPVKQYIIRRRIVHALYDVRHGAVLTESAMIYGFLTYAGFYKACRREFGFTPRELLQRIGDIRPELWKGDKPMLTPKIIHQLLTHWQLENEPVSAVFDGGGQEETNARYVGQNYMLRAEKDWARQQAECDIQQAMAGQALMAALPIKDVEDEHIVAQEDIFACLFRRMKGSRLQALEAYEPETAFQLGRVLGKLSLALSPMDYAADEVFLAQTIRAWALPKARKTLALPDSFCESFLSACDRLFPALPRQLIHRDPCPGNIVRDGNAWGFTHFDLMERNVRLFDPCYASTAILSETIENMGAKKADEWFNVYRQIMRGYDESVHMTEAESSLRLMSSCLIN